MKRISLLMTVLLGVGALPLRSQTAPPAAQPPAPSAGEGDRFAGLRENADKLKAAFDKTDSENMTQIETLMTSKKCQIARIGGLLDRTIEAMHQWQSAELQYWKVWGDAEAQSVDNQMKSLASMEADEQRAESLVSSAKNDREELLRQRAILEKYPKRTAEIIARMDAMVQDIKDSEARLTKAQETYEDVSIRVRNMKASISARLIDIRQNSQKVEAYGLQLASYYEDRRASAQEICNTKQPDTTRSPLPKKKTGQ